MLQITVHIGVLALGLGGAFVVGLLARTSQLSSLRKQITELEREKMDDHAEILQLQRQVADFQNLASKDAASAPVVPLIDKEPSAKELSKNKRASNK